MKSFRTFWLWAGLLLAGVFAVHAQSGRAVIAEKVKSPYLCAVAVDGHSGRVLFDDGADVQAYPASVLKLMDLYIVLDRVQQGRLRLDELVKVTKEAANTGGSQVYLKEAEQFTVDELLYALMVQSANDAAVALAIHVGGSKEGFVALMNEKAAALGMKNTKFSSVHGLPPAAGQTVDLTTPRDLALLARALILQHPDALKYTSTKSRTFRPDKDEKSGRMNLTSHNKLLETLAGCDGLKTGYFKAGGYSSVVTAARDGHRVITVVLGSGPEIDYGRARDKKAAEITEKAFTDLRGK